MRFTTNNRTIGRPKALLYRAVFETRSILVCVAVLVCALFLQPVEYVLANDAGSAADPDTEAPSSLPAEEARAPEGAAVEDRTVPEDTDEGAAVPEEPSPEAAGATPQSDETPPSSRSSSTEPAEESTTQVAASEPAASSPNPARASSTDVASSSTSLGGSTGDSSAPAPAPRATTTPLENASTTNAAATSTPTQHPATDAPLVDTPPSQPAETPIVTPPEPAPSATHEKPAEPEHVAVASSSEPAPFEVTVENDENRYQFSRTECVSVGDGAYYCSEAARAVLAVADGAFAEVDGEGDREIYLRRTGAVTQLTHNQLEDAAPFYDEAAGEVVFHRLVSGRYQIFRIDVETGEEEQLTRGRENNMEPTQDGATTVWQRWVSDNWDIVLSDEGGTRTITNSSSHDVAPVVRDGYIMWHTTGAAGEKLLSVYELESGKQSTIADPDGGHVENPRFVLVYDTAYENGDRVTKQYDPETGVVTPVGTYPAPAPVEVPQPDPSGETRALIGSKPAARESEEHEVLGSSSSTPKVGGGGGGATSTPSVQEQAASAEPSTAPPSELNLQATTTTSLELTEFDLVVLPRASTTDAEALHTASTTSGANA